MAIGTAGLLLRIQGCVNCPKEIAILTTLTVRSWEGRAGLASHHIAGRTDTVPVGQ